MSVSLSTATTAAFKAVATSKNSETPANTETLIVFAPVSAVQGLAGEIAAVYPELKKEFAIAIITGTNGVVYLEDSAESAADTMVEISYNVFEAANC